jgi:hypothetical protein
VDASKINHNQYVFDTLKPFEFLLVPDCLQALGST